MSSRLTVIKNCLNKNKINKFNYGNLQQKRFLNLHEYQSMEIMRDYGAHVPKFTTASNVKEAESNSRSLADEIKTQNKNIDFVVKAQVLSGGRGLGYFKENNFHGGVHICTSTKEVIDISEKMLGKTLITKQSGSEGKKCEKILIAERVYIRKEKYFAILMDRASGGSLLLGSSIGGTSIEDIAEKHPDAIIKMSIDTITGLSDKNVEDFVSRLGFNDSNSKQAQETIKALYKMFIEKDCLLVEVNPFAETNDNRVLVCDAKVNFDDNAEFRQQSIFNLRDETQEDSREIAAAKHDLNYVGLNGDIGCMVNGAGLAMATMDLIQLHGGKPANFLDVGGSANNDQVMEALKILQNDDQVNCIFINIFGGIMRCDIIALGLLDASKKIGFSKPIILRLEGTNKEQAKNLLKESGMKITFESDFNTAAKKAVKIAQIINLAKEGSVAVSFSS